MNIGNYTIHDYSEKSIVVTGPNLEKLASLNGLYNERLRIGPGLIFYKPRRQEVEAFLKRLIPPKTYVEEISSLYQLMTTLQGTGLSSSYHKKTKNIYIEVYCGPFEEIAHIIASEQIRAIEEPYTYNRRIIFQSLIEGEEGKEDFMCIEIQGSHYSGT